MTLPIDRNRLILCIDKTVGTVKYKLGAKPVINAEPGTFTKSDCSGYLRWILHQATWLKIIPPDGSWNQHEWCKRQDFKLCPYSDAAKSDSILRIAFIEAHDGKPGHVWLVISGKTIECCSRRGACRRAWNGPTLKNSVSACYVLTKPLP